MIGAVMVLIDTVKGRKQFITKRFWLENDIIPQSHLHFGHLVKERLCSTETTFVFVAVHYRGNFFFTARKPTA